MCVWKLYNKMLERFIFKLVCCFVLCVFYFFGEFFFFEREFKRIFGKGKLVIVVLCLFL